MQYQNDYMQQQPHQPVQQQYQPSTPQQPPVMEPTQQPASNSATFTADIKVLEYIQMVHPEMASAMINLAIKKFAESEDFWNYFVKDEFQSVAQKEQLLEKSKSSEPIQEEAPTAAPAMDFTSWG